MRGRIGRAILVILLLAAVPTAAGAQQPPPQPTISVKPNCSNSTTR